jgi:hypothetical protein
MVQDCTFGDAGCFSPSRDTDSFLDLIDTADFECSNFIRVNKNCKMIRIQVFAGIRKPYCFGKTGHEVHVRQSTAHQSHFFP